MACGYDDSIFLNLPSDKSLECPVCMSVLRDPHLLSCCGSHVCQVSDTYIQTCQGFGGGGRQGGHLLPLEKSLPPLRSVDLLALQKENQYA